MTEQEKHDLCFNLKMTHNLIVCVFCYIVRDHATPGMIKTIFTVVMWFYFAESFLSISSELARYYQKDKSNKSR